MFAFDESRLNLVNGFSLSDTAELDPSKGPRQTASALENENER